MAAIQCDACGTVLPPSLYNIEQLTPCPKCFADIQVWVFPAYYQPTVSADPGGLAEATDATCFFHPENRAIAPCAACGRFLCAVCRIDLAGETLCPNCVHSGVRARKLPRLEHRRVLYDNVALGVAAVPMLLIWPTLFTAPIAIFVAVRHWRAPSSLIRRTKIRFVLAIALGLLQLGFWGFLAYALAVTRGWV